MKEFVYLAADPTGSTRRGVLSADDPAIAADQLARQGLYPIDVREVASHWRLGRMPHRRDLAAAFRSLGDLIAIGAPLAEAVRTSAETVPPKLGRCLEHSVAWLERGEPLSRALEEAGVRLPPAAAGLLGAAERGGRLEVGLAQVASLLERQAEWATRTRQALTYPAVLAIVGLFSVVLIVGVVVPRFAVMLQDLGQDLPWATSFVLSVGRAGRTWGIWVALGLAGMLSLVAGWTRTPPGRNKFDRFLLSIPLVGPLLHQLASGRVSATLGGLLEGGLPLLAAVHAAGRAAGNSEIERRLAAVAERVAVGSPLGAAIAAENALTDSTARLAVLGDSTGRLAETLARAGDIALVDGERRVRALVSLIEPVLILGFALLIGFVAAALLQAVYALRPGVGT